MTISGCSKGNPSNAPTHNNLAPDMIEHFVEYARTVIDYHQSNLGLTFSSYAPFNEPSGLGGIGGWIGNTIEQEGCNMNRQVMVEVIRQLNETLEAAGMGYVEISAPDETQVNTAISTLEYFREQGVVDLFSKINVHGYWDGPGSRRDILSSFSAKEGRKLWMDEVYTMFKILQLTFTN